MADDGSMPASLPAIVVEPDATCDKNVSANTKVDASHGSPRPPSVVSVVTSAAAGETLPVDELDAVLVKGLAGASSEHIAQWVAELNGGVAVPQERVPSGEELMELDIEDLCDAPYSLPIVVASELLLRGYMLHHKLATTRHCALPAGFLSWSSQQVREWLGTLGPKQAPVLAEGSEVCACWTGVCLAAATNVLIRAAVLPAGKRYSLTDAAVLVDKVKVAREKQVKAGFAEPWTALWVGRVPIAEQPPPQSPERNESDALAMPLPEVAYTAPALVLAADTPPPPSITPTKIVRVEDAFTPIWTEHRVLERELIEATQYTLDSDERLCVPTDYPDVLDLTRRSHVQALIGQYARYDWEELRHVRATVHDFAAAVAAFKAIGDELYDIKRTYKGRESDEALLASARTKLEALREARDKVHALGESVRKYISDARESKGSFRPADGSAAAQSEFNGNKFPPEAARWFTRAVRAFKESERDEQRHTVPVFVRWLAEEDAIGVDPAARELIEWTGTRRPGFATVDKLLLEQYLQSYMRSFGTSLPPEAHLAITSRRRR